MKKHLFLSILFLVMTFMLAAQSGSETEDEDFVDMGEDSKGITLTDDRQKTPVLPEQDVFGAHNVVSDEQIKEQGSQDLLDTLRNVPGVMFSKHNKIGTNTATSLYIRGRGATHPALDVNTSFDGVTRTGQVYGQSMADAIPVYAADSIEVYKSPQPSAFGAGYGLMNVTPKYQRTPGWEFHGGFSFGSYGTFADNTSFGYKKGRFDIFAAQSWITTNGNLYHSGAQQESYYANGGFAINEHFQLRALVNYTTAFTEGPLEEGGNSAKILPRYDTDSTFSTVTLSNVFNKTQGYIKLYYNNLNFSWLHENQNPDDWSKQPATATGVKIRQTMWLWKDGEIIAGLDLDKTRMANEDHNIATPPSVYTDFPDMTLLSPFTAIAQKIGKDDGFHLASQAGIRGYIHDRWANYAAPQAGISGGYKNTTINFNYSLGVVYPAPASIQAMVNSDAYAIPDLKKVKPETVNHFEAGITHNQKKLFSVSASYFFDDGRNRILGTSRGGVTPDNASAAAFFQISGVEAAFNITPVKNLDLYAGGTKMWVKAAGEDGVEVDKMPYTPTFSVSAGLRCKFLGYFLFNADYQYLTGLYAGTLWRGDNFNEPAAINKLDDQHLLNARLSFGVTYPEWNINEAEIFVSVSNLLNRRYEYYPGYTMPGLAVTAGVDCKCD
jgi:iron complex outermembrane receptor protein